MNTYLKLKYYLEIKKIYISIEKGDFEKKKRHNLNKRVEQSHLHHIQRFKTLPLVLNSIQNQTILPDKIELWIEENDKPLLSDKIYKFKDVDIKICENGLFSYKKIIPSLKENDDRFIVTFDDDIIYPNNSLETLINQYKEYQGNIIANRVHKIKLRDTLPDKYIEWQKNFKGDSNLNFFTGVGGCSIHQNVFIKKFQIKKFLVCVTSNDDIWLNWMAKLNNNKIKFSGINREFVMIKLIKSGLFKKNVKQNYNDIQIKRIIGKYGFPFN